MTFAVISDIHGNLEALEAVLEDISKQGISEIYCLGDIIGYGANPKECLSKIRGIKSVKGDHEQALTIEQSFFTSPVAFQLTERTKTQLTREEKAYLKNLPYIAEIHPDIILVHGSLNEPEEFHYILRVDPNLLGTISRLDELNKRVCFMGHSHKPFFCTCDEKGVYFSIPTKGRRGSYGENRFFFKKDQKCVLNVGSVGQPKDGDPRPSYVIFDGNTAIYRRVPYEY